jgi:hypothetical protein
MLFKIRSRREVVYTSDVFITTTVEDNGLIALEDVSSPPLMVSLYGAIELSAKEHLLAFRKALGIGQRHCFQRTVQSMIFL